MESSASRFSRILLFIFKWECVRDRKGNVIAEHDPSDPGGLTKYGIDQRSHPKTDVANLTEEQATAIYKKEYWDRYKCNQYPKALGEVIFNCCVNCGYGRASKILAALSKPPTASAFLDEQEGFYRRLAKSKPSLNKFLKGWLNRTADLRKLITTL